MNTTTPNWFGMGTLGLNEEELKEQLEYDRAQLEILQMDIVNAEVRLSTMQKDKEEL
ncbi:hypothetical protein N9459_04305 [Flavobacteriaceae bacterium]|nr:hypothetical protein [Flavobacteriaceae bacterium]